MYNKIFTRILDSSVWLESESTRLVWVTFIAAMDEHGFCQFASPRNLARRANVSEENTLSALGVLESPDSESSDPEFEGRRVERVPGGWMVLNSEKYRNLVTRAISQEKTRIRVARHREKKKCNASVTVSNDCVTPSEAYTDTESKAEKALASTALALSLDRGILYEVIPLNRGEYEVRSDDLARDAPLYPGVDVRSEYRRMRAWFLANPTRRKTRKGIHRAMNTWLSKAQDNQKGGPNGFQGKSERTISALYESLQGGRDQDAVGGFRLEASSGDDES